MITQQSTIVETIFILLCCFVCVNLNIIHKTRAYNCNALLIMYQTNVLLCLCEWLIVVLSWNHCICSVDVFNQIVELITFKITWYLTRFKCRFFFCCAPENGPNTNYLMLRPSSQLLNSIVYALSGVLRQKIVGAACCYDFIMIGMCFCESHFDILLRPWCFELMKIFSTSIAGIEIAHQVIHCWSVTLHTDQQLFYGGELCA